MDAILNIERYFTGRETKRAECPPLMYRDLVTNKMNDVSVWKTGASSPQKTTGRGYK